MVIDLYTLKSVTKHLLKLLLIVGMPPQYLNNQGPTRTEIRTDLSFSVVERETEKSFSVVKRVAFGFRLLC